MQRFSIRDDRRRGTRSWSTELCLQTRDELGVALDERLEERHATRHVGVERVIRFFDRDDAVPNQTSRENDRHRTIIVADRQAAINAGDERADEWLAKLRNYHYKDVRSDRGCRLGTKAATARRPTA